MKILVAYDGSASADAAIEDMRRAGLPDDSVALVACVSGGELTPHESPEGVAADSWRTKLAGAEELADIAAARISDYFPRWSVSSEALWGSPAKVILDLCGRWRPDLIIVGSHGHSRIAGFFLGSVSLELIHKAACSVRIARRSESAAQGPVQLVVGNDGSAESDAVIRSVAARSWPKDTQVQVVSVVQTLVPIVTALEANTYAHESAYTVIREADERMRIRLNSIAEESANVLRRAGLVVRAAVIDGDPREAILEAAESLKADTILVGARGHGRMQRLLLGSVSSYLATHAHCTVEIVRNRIA